MTEQYLRTDINGTAQTWAAQRFIYSSPVDIFGPSFGAGRGKTILDFSTADPADFAERSCITLHDSATLTDLTVIGIGANLIPTISLIDCNGASIRRVNSSGSNYACIHVLRGSNILIDDCTTEDHSVAVGYNYGVALISCSDVLVRACNLQATRHGVAMGYLAPAGPATRCVVHNCKISSDIIYAANMHEMTIGCAYISCNITNGMNIGGNQNRVIDCDINLAQDGRGIYLINLEGLDVEILNCRILGVNDGIVGAIEWDDSGSPPTITGGIIRLLNNDVNITGRCILMRNRFDGLKPDLQILDNTLRGTSQSQILSLGVPSRWQNLIMRQNTVGVDGVPFYGAHVNNTDVGDNYQLVP